MAIPLKVLGQAIRERNARNRRKDRSDWPICECCWKLTDPKRARWVYWQDGELLSEEERSHEIKRGYEVSLMAIGPDCWKKRPEIHGFEVVLEGQSKEKGR